MESLRPSGMERMLVSAAPYFAEADVESVVVGQGSDHPFASELGAAGYEVRVIPRVKSTRGLRSWAALLREERPDVVHIHPEQMFALSVMGARLAAPQARVIRTLHSYFFADGWWGAKRRAQALVSDRFVDTFVALSSEMAQHEASFRRAAVVIPNWVDDCFLDAQDQGARDIDLVLVGNCAPVKAHEVVLTAALSQGWTVAHLGNETGSEPGEVALLDELEERGLLVRRGAADPLPWIQRARVFAMPSTREGFGVALAEAVSLGAVCVVADAPGLEWAREYPLVSHVAGRDEESWRDALRGGAVLAGQSSTAQARVAQRKQAQASLAAGNGAANYMRVYVGQTGGVN